MSDVGGVATNKVQQVNESEQLRLATDSAILSRWTMEIWETALTRNNIPLDTRYVKIASNGNASLGVFQVHRFTTPNNFIVKVSTESKIPSEFENAPVKLIIADEGEFKKHQNKRLKPARIRAFVGLALLVVGGAIQVSWDIGKVAPVFHSSADLAIAALVVKYIAVVAGAALAFFNDYPRP